MARGCQIVSALWPADIYPRQETRSFYLQFNSFLLVGDILGTFLTLYILPLLVWVMIYFIIRPPKRGGKLIRSILIGVLALLVAPFLLLGFAFGGIRGVIGVIVELAIIPAGFLVLYLLLARIVKPIGAIFDGGDEPPDAAPFYHIAHLCRKQRKYEEALARIEQQLQKFPTDFEGQMLLAEIQAENLSDLSSAQNTVNHLIRQKNHAPETVARALNKLADWHLQIGQDKVSAQDNLMKIIELFPDTELARAAYGRLSLIDNKA